MREHFLARLLELPRIQDRDVRRGVFRQTIATLGLGEVGGPLMVLAGVDPRALGRSMQVALADGLLEDLSFIAPSAAAVALYQIASALPLGPERRALGRSVLSHLYTGNADTFAALASRMAFGSIRTLAGAGIRARVALALSLHGSSDGSVDRLALAIVTRRELASGWICTGATGSLPDRRLAARLLERAAREVARRCQAGDDHPLRIFGALRHASHATASPQPGGLDAIGAAWHTLLADRETLVWRHVGVARGLLCGVVPELARQVAGLLDPQLGPTEWRRGATSLVARVAVDLERGLADALALLDGPLLRRDPGIAQAMVWGLTPVAEVEPEAAEELLEAIATISPISIAESVADLRLVVPGFGERAVGMCIAALRASLTRPELDDGLTSLANGILQDLEHPRGRNRELLGAVRAAIDAFADEGTEAAFRLARRALGLASTRVAALEALDLSYDAGLGSSAPRRQAMTLLRDIDSCLLESRELANLLLLDRPPGSTATGVAIADDLDARMARWLLDPRRRSATPDEVKSQATLHQRQLRALLHLIDGGNTDFGEDHDRRLRVRARWTLACRVFVADVRKNPGSRLTRAVIATVARAFDALVRDGAAEAVDVFLYAATYFSDPAHMAIVAEASMHPDVTQLLGGYVEFVNASFAGSSAQQAEGRLGAFKRFLGAFPIQTTLRAESFRTTAWVLARAVESVMEAASLSVLVPQDTSSDAGPLAAIEDAIAQMQELVVGAERRCNDSVSKQRAVRPRRHALAHAVENAVNTRSDQDLLEALTTTARAADAILPAAMATLVTQALPRLATLPTEPTSEPPPPSTRLDPLNLPPWLPSRRILGGFYVLRQLGGGNVGTVFVVKRAEERHDPGAACFALKVPEYDATAARTMSEADFLDMFRQEAGALLSIPHHGNIARFVTFDAGAKPKPILVTELVEGVSCERVISTQSLDTARAVGVLAGVLDGLDAMHGVGIAHLDVKPSNVIIREGGHPVLVDFGLAGRKLRPGCATLCYGAPEVWEGTRDSPAPAVDVYAFGCFAYEVMTGATLFDGPSDVAVISAHITHDGMPPAVRELSRVPALAPLAGFLERCLRAEPRLRADVATLRRELPEVTAGLLRLPWPLRAALPAPPAR